VKRSALVILLSAMAAGCGADTSISGEEIRESIRVGEDAAEVTPPHGFALYPDATVLSSMLGGMMMTVETTATERDLAEFYTGELKRLGWSRVSSQRGTKGSLMVEGRSPDRPDEFLVVTIGAGKREGVALVGFVKGSSKD
jgi:hypothetical protein